MSNYHMIRESRIRRLLHFDDKDCYCCLSCHEDMDMGFGGVYVELGKGRRAEVCCFVANALETRQKEETDHVK